MPNGPHIAVLGAGAVGCYFGGMLARSGAQVTLIGRPQHVEAIVREGLYLNSPHFRGHIPVSASTAPQAADIVLLCVKTLDTESAIQTIAPLLPAGAIVVSMQNGVDNIERIRSVAGIDAIPVVVYVAAQMTAPGALKHNGRGDLVLPAGAPAARVAALFEQAGVPCRISADISVDLWTKMIMNCVYNAMSALSRAKYGRLVHDPMTRDLMRQVVEETVSVAARLGVGLSAPDLTEAAFRLGEAMTEATSSTAQDLARGKRTEIDSLNGYVVRRAAELAVPVPVNQALYALVKVLETVGAAAA